MLQVRENEISLRRWSGGASQLRTLAGTLAGRNLPFIDKDEKLIEWNSGVLPQRCISFENADGRAWLECEKTHKRTYAHEMPFLLFRGHQVNSKYI